MELERCNHGLCRNCHLCYYENEIARLKEENAQLAAELMSLKGIDPTEPLSEAEADTGPLRRNSFMNTGTKEIAEEIRKALEEATTGPWEICTDKFFSNAKGITKRTDQESGYYLGGGFKENDAHLIANAPTWLRSLLEERELNELAMDRMVEIDEEKNATIQQLREELERIRKSGLSWMDSWREAQVEIQSLRSELAATRREITEIGKEATAGLNGDLERADAALQRINLLSKNILAAINESNPDTATTPLG